MKKNNKGFFLAETIVMIALVTTVMAFVYPNVAKLYENYKNKTVYYDQTEDIYTLRAVYEYLLDTGKIDEYTYYNKDKPTETIEQNNNENNYAGCKIFNSMKMEEINEDNVKIGDLKKLYITGYMTEVSNDDYEFNKYLKRMKKTTFDTPSYRLIGIFEKDDKKTYASIKIDNPNPNRNCNLGGS